MKVTVWNEFKHEVEPGHESGKVYPEGIHKVIAGFLAEAGFDVKTATLDEPEHGLTDEVLADTDVLIWWGHMAHHEVSDEIVQKVFDRVMFGGMGFIALHSGHFSKPFGKLMGTGCNLKWNEYGESERVWVINPAHPITKGLPEYFDVPKTEMYGERFDIPQPDDLIFVSWYPSGEVFRSGCCWSRGKGKVFYFSPGHETYPIYKQKEIQQVIINAVNWAAPTGTEVTYGQWFDRFDKK